MFQSLVQLAKSHLLSVVLVAILLALIFVPPVRRAAKAGLRLAVWPVLLVALVALLNDGTRTLASRSGLVVTPFIEQWRGLSPGSLEAVRRTVMVKLHPVAWDYGFGLLLRLPVWLLLVLVALLFAAMGRRRRSTRVFAN